jgi:hypothetical protein
MGVYLQLGDRSVNLLREQRLHLYRGAILSPVNYPEHEVKKQIATHQGFGYELIFDPQLYFPKSARGQLPNWAHYPKDVDSADTVSDAWWSERISVLSEVVKRLGPGAVCSPATSSRVFSASYYARMIAVADELRDSLKPTGIDVLPTVIANLRDHSDRRKVSETASIVTRSSAERVYLVFSTEVDPRRELFEAEDIAGGLRLIRALEESGIKVLLGFTSSDIILWKAAGATHCASGKFFNLRRFTPSRWDPPAGGGGQIEYWFEEALLAFLREPDLVKVKSRGMLSEHSNGNPFARMILDMLAAAQNTAPDAWLSESWTQFLYWFQDVEQRLREGKVTADQLLATAASNWDRLTAEGVFFDENPNDGHWINRWQQALRAFRRD